MTSSRKTLLFALGSALVFAVALVIYGENRPLERTFHGSVKDLLPTEAGMPGWKVEYLPIADTPEMQAKVSEILNYDDAVYAVYTKGSERISIYIAYWTPGKMSHRLVAGHTPDVCWVKAGWSVLDRGDSPTVRSAKASQILPGEWRVMALRGSKEEVLFWHIVGGKPKSYSTNWRPAWHAALRDVVFSGFQQREEQFFVRLSSGHSGNSLGPGQALTTFAATIPPLRSR